MYRLDWWFVIVLVLVAIFPIGMGVTGGIGESKCRPPAPLIDGPGEVDIPILSFIRRSR